MYNIYNTPSTLPACLPACLPSSIPSPLSPDCGSGIGRVTKRLLLPLFSTVDMVEQNASFLEKSKVYLGPAGDRVEQRIAKGLQVCQCGFITAPSLVFYYSHYFIGIFWFRSSLLRGADMTSYGASGCSVTSVMVRQKCSTQHVALYLLFVAFFCSVVYYTSCTIES